MKFAKRASMVVLACSIAAGAAVPATQEAPATAPGGAGRGPITIRPLSTARPSRPAARRAPPPPNAFGIIADTPDGWKRLEGSHGLQPDAGQRRVFNGDRPTVIEDATGVLSDHKGAIGALRFFPDSQSLASGGADGIVRIWNVATGKVVKRLAGPRHPIFSLAISPDAKRLAEGEVGGTIRVYDLGTARQIATFVANEGNVHQVQFLPDNKTLISGGCDGAINMWNSTTGERLGHFAAHDRCVQCLRTNAQGTEAISGSDDGSVKIIDFKKGTVAPFPGIDNPNFAVGWGVRENEAFAFKSGWQMRLYDVAAGKVEREFTTHMGGGFRIGQTADRSLTAFAGDETATVLTTSNMYTVGVLEGATQSLKALDIAPNGSMVAGAGSSMPIYLPQDRDPDPRIFLWDLRKLGIHAIANPAVAFAATEDGALSAIARADGSADLVASDTGKVVGSLARQKVAIGTLAFSPDGRSLLTVAGTSVGLWDAGTAAPKGHWEASEAPVGAAWHTSSAIFAGVGHELVEWSLEGVSKVIESGPGPVHSFAAAPDDRCVVISFKGGLTKIFPRGEGKGPMTLNRARLNDVDALAITPDSRRLLMFDRQYGTLVWNLATGNLLSQARSDRDGVEQIVPINDSQACVVYEGSDVRFFDADMAMFIDGEHLPFGIAGARYAAGRGRLIVGGVDGKITASPFTLPEVLGRNIQLRTSVISPDGGTAAVIAGDAEDSRIKTLDFYDLSTGKRRGAPAELSERSGVRTMSFSPDGKLVIAGGGADVFFFDAGTGKLVRSFKGPAGAFAHVALSPDGSRLASAQGSASVRPATFDAVVHIWDVEKEREVFQLPAQDAPVEGMAWSPEGKRLLVRVGGRETGDLSATLWDAASGKLVHTFRMINRPYAEALFSRDGRQIILVDTNGAIQVCDAASYEVKSQFNAGRHLSQAVLSPDGRRLLLSGMMETERSRRLMLVEVASGKELGIAPEGRPGDSIPFFMKNEPWRWWNDDGLAEARQVTFLKASEGGR
jgi:WD40 repeat protein